MKSNIGKQNSVKNIGTLSTVIRNDINEINRIRTGQTVTLYKKTGGIIVLPTGSFMDKLTAWLTLIEGYANTVYLDGKGLKTVGIGHYMGNPNGDKKAIAQANDSKDAFSKTLGMDTAEWLRIYNGVQSLDDEGVNKLFSYDVSTRLPSFKAVLGRSPYSVNYDDLNDHQKVSLLAMFFNGPVLIGDGIKRALNTNNILAQKREIVERSNRENSFSTANRRLKDWAIFNNQDAATVRMPDSTVKKLTGAARKGVIGHIAIEIDGPNPNFVLEKKKPEVLLDINTVDDGDLTREWTWWDTMAQGSALTQFTNVDTKYGKALLGRQEGAVLNLQDIGNNKRGDEDEISQLDNAIIAGEKNDMLIGLDSSTHFYANDGNDTTRGGTGDDHHIPGKGNDLMEDKGGSDKYYFDPNNGHDIIDDSDGKGEIHYNGLQISGKARFLGEKCTDEKKWFISKSSILFVLKQQGGDLVITVDNVDKNTNSITIKDFDFMNGKLGITIPEEECNCEIQKRAETCENKEPVKAIAWRDPNLLTFDKLQYDFQAPGHYTLVKGKGVNDTFEIQVRNKLLNPRVSVIDAVGIQLDDTKLTLMLPQEKLTPTVTPRLLSPQWEHEMRVAA